MRSSWARGSREGFCSIAVLMKNFSPRVLRSAGPMPNSWLADGPPTPRSVLSATTDIVTGVFELDVKLICPLAFIVNWP